MSAQARSKALFRAKLNAAKKEKRIDSPLIRYNESDQPVCRVCDVVLKSESLWDAHQASRKHHEAIMKLKASAAAVNQSTSVKGSATELPKATTQPFKELPVSKPESSVELKKSKPPSGLPPGFFDDEGQSHEAGGSHMKAVDATLENEAVGLPGGVATQTRNSQSSREIAPSGQNALPETRQAKGVLPEGFFDSKETSQASRQTAAPETTQAKGVLPEGFFDNKDADLRARGIKPVKIDVKDEYKEFEKLIQDDLREVDDRLEEEEIDAAEMIEEAESVEQKTCRERVEMVRKKKLELKAARSAKRRKGSEEPSKESDKEESSSDDETHVNFAVDWRAQHL